MTKPEDWSESEVSAFFKRVMRHGVAAEHRKQKSLPSVFNRPFVHLFCVEESTRSKHERRMRRCCDAPPERGLFAKSFTLRKARKRHHKCRGVRSAAIL